MSQLRSTTVLLVRRDGHVCMAADGQVTLEHTVVKAHARKVRRAGKGQVLVGFAGGAADGLALFTRFGDSDPVVSVSSGPAGRGLGLAWTF